MLIIDPINVNGNIRLVPKNCILCFEAKQGNHGKTGQPQGLPLRTKRNCLNADKTFGICVKPFVIRIKPWIDRTGGI